LRVGQLDALHFSVICDGPALGACCDMLITECKGGLLNGELCDTNADCQPVCNQGFCSIGCVGTLDPPVPCTHNNQCTPGTCESVCREVPEANCPFPPRFTSLRPAWAQGKLCANDTNAQGGNLGGPTDPFPLQVCGESQCCYENTLEDTVCENLTRNVCDQQEPVHQPRQWLRGQLCGLGQLCPFIDCLDGGGGGCFDCPHEPGCADPACCMQVCWADSYCCLMEWDCYCRARAAQVCDSTLANDECFDERGGYGAQPLYEWAYPDMDLATENAGDPPVCNGAAAFGTVWFKFTAPPGGIVEVSTCASDAQDGDTVLQVLAPRDRCSEEAACNSLEVLASNDDLDDCGSAGTLSRLAVHNLLPGDTYYVMFGAKSAESKERYEVRLRDGYYLYQVLGDTDFDDDTDLADVAELQHCYTGEAGGETPACCGLLDVADRDGNVALDDAEFMLGGLSGPQGR
jgi:hypothetical protein